MDEKVIIQQKPPKSPVLAGLLAFFFPFGTGAFYNGQYLKGLLYFISFAGLVTLNSQHGGQPFSGLALAGLIIFQFFESIQSAKAINQEAAGPKTDETVKSDALPQVLPSGSVFWGIVLMVIGALAILANFDVITWEKLWDFWPVAVIIVGLKLVFDSVAKAKKGK